jgi:hypothetical protein
MSDRGSIPAGQMSGRDTIPVEQMSGRGSIPVGQMFRGPTFYFSTFNKINQQLNH